ncbi:MAG TPA: hypothetical protein VIZ43_27915 [Trebonia sp.]
MTKITISTINARRTCRDWIFDGQLRGVDLRVAAGYSVTNALYLGASKPQTKANPWYAELWDSVQEADVTTFKRTFLMLVILSHRTLTEEQDKKVHDSASR